MFLDATLQIFSNPSALVVFFAALLGGLFVGAVPGLSVLTLAAVILPFTTLLAADHAIMLYGVLYVSGVYGGAITAILFNIPGSVENAPTAFDGYPMAQKGQASKAIGLTMLCSAIGGVTSVLLLMLATEPIARFGIRVFGPIEIFALICFGLAVVTSIGGSNPIKSWIAMLLGLFLACVGGDPVSGVSRFSFDSLYLVGGISFVPLILGLFALSEVFVQGLGSRGGARDIPKVTVDLPKLRDFLRMRFTILRSTVIGWFCGLVPGVGATFAAFYSYSEARRWSRTPESFGSGNPEGVVAPETANNAATGTAMIPLLALGLPGGALTAMMIGVFNLHGMEVGPLVMTQAPDLVWMLFTAMLWASLAILLIGLIEAKLIVHLLRIPMSILAPLIVVFTVIGAYSLRGSIADVYTMMIAGVLGFILRKGGYSIAALVMGFILGQLGERSLSQAVVILDYSALNLVDRPLALIILLLAAATTIATFAKYVRSRNGSADVPQDLEARGTAK